MDSQSNMKGKYLITCNEWFLAPDGKQYRAVWGEVEILEDAILGVKTNRNSTNWYAKVGDKESHVIISGCQINYAVKFNGKPNTGPVKEYTTDKGYEEDERPTQIYIP